MKSMTGFGQADRENGECRVGVTLRSVNHRFLDLAIRLADEHRDLEPSLRQLLSDRLARGRVEVRVSVESLQEVDAAVAVNDTVVSGFLSAARQMKALGLSEDPLTAGDLLRLPDVVRVNYRSQPLTEAGRALIFETVEEAIERLLAMRQSEGAQLEGFLAQRLEDLGLLVERLSGVRDQVRTGLVERMKARLAELIEGPDPEPDRLAQEAVILAEKIDVQEELDRLGAHLEGFSKAMATDVAVGRRLDFLAQEIHRELNTLGSKCRDAQMAEWVIDGKVACEQLREQVQNVE